MNVKKDEKMKDNKPNQSEKSTDNFKKFEENSNQKEINLNKEEKNVNVKLSKEEELKKQSITLQFFFFFFFSCISTILVIIINRLIISSFKDITSRLVLYSILIVYFSSFFISLLFYAFFSIPLINYKIKKKSKKKKNKKSTENKNYTEENQNEQNFDKQKYEIISLKKEQNYILNSKVYENKQTIIIGDKEDINNNENNNNTNQKINKNEPIKVCTCIGYVFFQKKLGDKDVCIFYDYDSLYSWFSLKLRKPKIIVPFFIELFIQLLIVGFNFILSDNFLKVYSIKKNYKFFSCLSISVFYIYYLLHLVNRVNAKDIFNFTSVLFFIYSLYTLIFSIIYLANGKPSGKHWENTIMSEIVFMKMLDFHMLTFYDFFDDLDCLNTSVVITFARYLWILIEVLIDILEIKTTILISLQIGFSSICFFSILFIVIINIDFPSFIQKLIFN